MDLYTIAVTLLSLRVISSAVYIYIILAITFPNLRAENDAHVLPVRWVLFILSVLLLSLNVIPILVDATTIIESAGRPSRDLGGVLFYYTFNNAIGALLSSLGFLLLFKVSNRVNVKLQAMNQQLASENTDLQDSNDEFQRLDDIRNR